MKNFPISQSQTNNIREVMQINQSNSIDSSSSKLLFRTKFLMYQWRKQTSIFLLIHFTSYNKRRGDRRKRKRKRKAIIYSKILYNMMKKEKKT